MHDGLVVAVLIMIVTSFFCPFFCQTLPFNPNPDPNPRLIFSVLRVVGRKFHCVISGVAMWGVACYRPMARGCRAHHPVLHHLRPRLTEQ